MAPPVAYREDALYANLRRVYEENPTAKYFGSFGAAHVQMENYVQKEGSSGSTIACVPDGWEKQLLDGRLTVIDGAITHEIGELGRLIPITLPYTIPPLQRTLVPKAESSMPKLPTPRMKKSRSMCCCLSIRLRSRPVRISQAGIGKTIKKIKRIGRV